MLALISLFVILTSAFQEYEKYELTCPEGLSLNQQGIHACCTGKGRQRCVLCARLSPHYYDTCAVNCRGNITETAPYHKTVECRPLSKEQLAEKQKRHLNKKPAHSGCPYMKSKLMQEEEEKGEL